MVNIIPRTHDLDVSVGKTETSMQGNEYALQTPHEFRDDFVAHIEASTPGQRVLLEVMQFEVTEDTEPVFTAMQAASRRGVSTEFNYDRVALRHIRAEKDEASQAYSYLGHNIIKFGDKGALAAASQKRRQFVRDMELLGIASPASKAASAQMPRGSHDHIKLAIVGDVAWAGTMNLRGIDFSMSNFMIKFTDPSTVEFLRGVFDESVLRIPTEDRKYVIDGSSEMLVDGGRRRESIIYDKAVEMAQSLGDGDEFIMISQWPPVKIMYGELSGILLEKMRDNSVRGEFLLPPEDKLHPHKGAARHLQSSIEKTQSAIPNMTITNLARPTHAKVFLIRRANGDVEALEGSHNFTKWTVKNGTRELAMWSQDPGVTSQLEAFLNSVKSEQA